MSGYVAPVLADLEARAGASDQDREAWLAERRGGVTATEVRDLYLRKIGRSSFTSQQELIDRKLGRVAEADLSGVPVIDWGNAREPRIAAAMKGEGFRAESRVFHHPDNSRYLASPDGIRVDFDEALDVLEIKTAGHDLPPGSEAIAAKGYELQVQWVMFVLGARRCRFVVEERIGNRRTGFLAGDLYRHWIERDDEVIAALVAVADEFLAELDRQAEGEGPAIDEHVDTLALNYLRGLAAEKEGKALKESAYRALIAAGVSQESAIARVTYSAGTPTAEVDEVVVDLAAAEAAHPVELAALDLARERLAEQQAAWDALAEKYTKKVRSTVKGKPARVTVTEIKEKAA